MAEKLNWVYDDQSGEQIARVRDDIRIRAVRDDDAQNPFTSWDTNWSIVVRTGRSHCAGFTAYSDGGESNHFDCPLASFNDALLIHWQQRIAIEFKSTVRDLIECYNPSQDELPEGKRACRDADVLRDAFGQAWNDTAESEMFDLAVKLYAMADIVALSGQTTGYSQGDWAEILVVAKPEEIKRFGCTEPIKPEDLQDTIDLYGAWAWGGVYGYIVERKSVCAGNPDDEDEVIWDEVPDGSCWGYYGTDHAASGLEEAALECVPERELVDV